MVTKSLHKIIGDSFRIKDESTVSQTRLKILMEIYEKYKISATKDDLDAHIYPKTYQTINGNNIEQSFYVYFTPNQSLIDKIVINFPEALI
jgi:hypothetical protein